MDTGSGAGSSEEGQGAKRAPQARVVDRALFVYILNHEVQKAIRLRYCVSLLCVTADGPGRSSRALTRRLADVVTRQLRMIDLGTCLPPSSLGLLLIDAEPRDLTGIMERVNRALETQPVGVLGSRHPMTLSGGAGCYPKTAVSGQELLQQAVALLDRAKRDGGNRLYLPS